MRTFYWHDYETWGSNPSIDKPAQFAGIRTDESLNTIGQPLVCYCRPVADTLPHPQACLTTGITPQKAFREGQSEPEFFYRIHQELSQPYTCGVGYNSIRFDDEVTRYGLYRNFYDPYEREWKHGNSRWDIIDLVRLTYALRPDTLLWPEREPGVPSFRLEELSVANGLEHTRAHDALADVYATIALAKLIKQRQPKMFDYVYQLRDKKRVAALIDIQQRKPLLHISSRFPADRGCAALVAPLMVHPRNANSVICYDLSVDPTPLLTLTVDEIIERVFVKQAELAAGIDRIPLKEIHLNKSPVIATNKLLDDASARRLGINRSRCESHWQRLSTTSLDQKLRQVYQRQTFPPSVDAEQQLYDGFINEHDRQLLCAIRQSSPEGLGEFAEHLKDNRLKTLLFRYRARHFPTTLNQQEQLLWQEWCYWRLTDKEAGGSIVLDDYFAQLDALSSDKRIDQNLIRALQNYGYELS